MSVGYVDTIHGTQDVGTAEVIEEEDIEVTLASNVIGGHGNYRRSTDHPLRSATG